MIIRRDTSNDLTPQGPTCSVEWDGRTYTVAPAEGLVLDPRGRRWTSGCRRDSEGKYRYFAHVRVHHLICAAIHGPRRDGQVCMHKDSKWLDEDGMVVNRAENIVGWGSPREHSEMDQGIKVVVLTSAGDVVEEFPSISSAARQLGVSPRTVSRAVHKEKQFHTRRHGSVIVRRQDDI